MRYAIIMLLLLSLVSCSEKQKEATPLTVQKTEQPAKEDTIVDKNTTIPIGVLDYVMPLSASETDSLTGKHGLYVDIATELAKRLNKKLHVYYEKDYYFKRPIRKGIIAGNCQIQLGIPSPGSKEKFIRKGKVIATEPYMTLGYVVVLPKDSPIKKIIDLKGKKVAFMGGSPPLTTVSLVGAKFEPVVDNDEGMRLLDEGKADAAFIWGARAGYLNKYLYNNKFDIYTTPYKWDVVMGLKVEDEMLKDKMNSYINDMRQLIKELEGEYGIAFTKKMDIPKNLL